MWQRFKLIFCRTNCGMAVLRKSSRRGGSSTVRFPMRSQSLSMSHNWGQLVETSRSNYRVCHWLNWIRFQPNFSTI